ncbi:MAG: FadR/GntR family transcriptional regulator [Clostridiales bacterium]
MEDKFKKIKRSTVADTIVEQIKQMILEEKLLPGERLPSERELADMLGVSRPPVREALKALATLKIVDIRVGEGTFLNNGKDKLMLDFFQLKNLQMKFAVSELIEARLFLEMEIVDLAAQRRDEQDLERIEESFNNTLNYEDNPEAFLNADFEFHLAIAEAAKNAYLSEMLDTTRDLLLEYNKTVIAQPNQMVRATDSHRNIFMAIKEKNAKKAKQEMKRHIEMLMLEEKVPAVEN